MLAYSSDIVQGPINILRLLFLFRIAFTIRAVTSLKCYSTCLEYNQHADAILDNRASYSHELSSVERAVGHFLWDPGPMNVTISGQKIDFVT